ncbi:hypothetical protein, partial [Bradyrhizobium sp. 136]|uniref:hypothetical protein n=1 Tax=Bradyrhizobium sp. 136 TaxID=2782613 RepID=UPI001FF736B6
LRYQGYLRRQDSHAVITALVSDGVPLKEIVRRRLAAAAVRICSAPVKAPWTGICRSWTRSGQAAVATVPSSGAG